MLLAKGSIVRIYYDQDNFDEGRVHSIVDGFVNVDFFDWIERWPIDKLRQEALYFEAITIWFPTEDGEIIIDFHLQNREKITANMESMHA